jgi:predicted nuclease with TOPRIM domain
MSRTWKSVGLTVLTLSLLVVAGGRSVADEPLKALEKRVEALEKELTDPKGQLRTSLDGITKSLNSLDERMKTLEPLNNASLQLAGLEESIKKINSRIDNLQNNVAKLDSDLRSRVARSIDPDRLTSIGTIRLQNRSGVPATVILNNAAYPLAAYETRLLENQRAGTFTYEVLADGYGTIQGRVARILDANYTYNIMINP